ncbi:MAG: sulfur carrier protein ThiS [Oscillospiraceae bacterium]|jgi:thiamine biosynthesis protein ThiS|nr:sulfur carrier protein ThiS [Oscillospiraceae bacterium]MBQ6895756.1 sulfur carrier protein ThiS [Oscillospiraceae bacterium]MBQ6929996.1 sulfur carrier protein ThiS [Oscillospiraceae bacterium]MBQ9844689.1 sulfur carrier protein ThiS [Oscillospiraceae bacterium]MBR2028371.1 sulfur carrier protein ThiS [Oscillospiraceae bacterium]
MMLNDLPYPDWHEGLTIQGVIEHMNYTWPKLVTKVNGQLVWPEDYGNVVLQENDDLKIHHLLAGG